MPPLSLAKRALSKDILSQLNIPMPLPPADLPPADLAPPTRRIADLAPRQNSNNDNPEVIIPAHYGSLNNSLAPAAIAGIVLGSVAGFLLLLFFIYSCCNIGPPIGYRPEWGASRVTVARSTRSGRSRAHSHSHSHHHHHHKRHSPRGARVYATETTRIRESTGPAPRGPIIVDADPPMTQRTRSMSRPPPSRVDDDDEVVVIEENTPPRRTRRPSGSRRSRDSRD